jgi:hypothetical protein
MSPQATDFAPAAPATATFDPLTELDDLLSTVGLARATTGGTVSMAGQDPIVPAAHRLGACIGIPIMAGAVAAVAFHRRRGGPAQDLALDLRQAVHGINPGAFWHPTVNGEPAPHPLVLDNPFLLTPYRTADGRLMTLEGTKAEPRLPITGMINDYVTGYLGAPAPVLVPRGSGRAEWRSRPGPHR